MTLAILAAVALVAAAPAPAPAAPASGILSLDGAVKLALEHHPDLRGVRADVSAASARVGQARASLLPQLAATASYDRQHVGSGADARESDVLAAGGSVDQLVWDFGRSTLAQSDGLRQRLRLELEQALAGVESAKAASGAAVEALEAAAEGIRLAEARYQTGAGTLLELSTARTARATAAGQVIQASWDLSAARADLALALGEG